MTNLLANPDFALPTDRPQATVTQLTIQADDDTGVVLSVTGRSETAALDWAHGGHLDRTVLSTDLLPSTDGDGSMLHVCSTKEYGGIVQVFPPGHDASHQGPTSATATARVYVVRGRVGLGLGDGGATALTAFSTTTGTWETITYDAHGTSLDEVLVEAADADGACFYIDHVSVEATP